MGRLGSRDGHRHVQARLGTPLFGQNIFSGVFASENFPTYGVIMKFVLFFGVLQLRI